MLAMHSISTIYSFLKSLGGPRNLIFIVIFLIIVGVLIHQYLQNRKTEESKYIYIKDRELFTEGNKLKDIIIAGIALLLVISFLVVTALLVYLITAD